MKPFPWKCATCRERAVKQVVLPTYTVELDHDGRKHEVTVTDLTALRCDNCGAISLDDEASEELSDALRVSAGLLSPAEIRAGREGLGLSQKQMADHLRISVSTLSRWETGAQIQQRVMDAFMRVFFRSHEARRILGVPEADRITVLDPRETVGKFALSPRRPASTSFGGCSREDRAQPYAPARFPGDGGCGPAQPPLELVA